MASASADTTIKIWDLESGVLIKELIGHLDILSTVAFSPDGETLASGGYDKTIKIWNLEQATLIIELKGHRDFAN